MESVQAHRLVYGTLIYKNLLSVRLTIAPLKAAGYWKKWLGSCKATNGFNVLEGMARVHSQRASELAGDKPVPLPRKQPSRLGFVTGKAGLGHQKGLRYVEYHLWEGSWACTHRER